KSKKNRKLFKKHHTIQSSVEWMRHWLRQNQYYVIKKIHKKIPYHIGSDTGFEWLKQNHSLFFLTDLTSPFFSGSFYYIDHAEFILFQNTSTTGGASRVLTI